MKGLFGKAIDVLGYAIDLRTKRNIVLSSNIANVDTPGYKARDIPFKKIMAEYLDGAQEPVTKMRCTRPGHMAPDTGEGIGPGAPEAFMVTTDPGHIATHSIKPEDVHVVQSKETGTPNNVDLDKEMAKLAANNLQYQTTVQALIKELELIKVAITEGGRV